MRKTRSAQGGLRTFLLERIAEGYSFPLNPAGEPKGAEEKFVEERRKHLVMRSGPCGTRAGTRSTRPGQAMNGSAPLPLTALQKKRFNRLPFAKGRRLFSS